MEANPLDARPVYGGPWYRYRAAMRTEGSSGTHSLVAVADVLLTQLAPELVHKLAGMATDAPGRREERMLALSLDETHRLMIVGAVTREFRLGRVGRGLRSM